MSVVAKLRGFFDGSMRANAVALVGNQLASASLGFVYWLLAARLYAVEVVGMSSAVISTVQLVSGLAQLGLVSGMQRFIPRAGKNARRLAIASYLVVTASAAIAGVIALFAAEAIAPGQGIFGGISPVYIVLAAVAWTLFYLQDGVLIGLREAVWVFVENFAYNFAKNLPLVVAAGLLTDAGIIASWFVPAPVAVLFVSGLIFGRLLRPERLRDHDDPAEHVTAREIITSTSSDHVGAMVAEAALRVLPLLVVRLAGVEANAYFYQAWMISTVLGLVASGMGNSFTADTAADRRRVGPNSRTILRTMSLLLLPAALIVGIGAPLVLRVFGESYAREGAGLLRVLAIAVVPVIVNTWYVSYLRVMGYIRKLIAVRVLSSVVLVGLAFLGLQYWGIVGVGVAWLVSQTGVAIFAVIDARGVLSVSAKDQRPRSSGMRRADWRFLLPLPHPEKTAVFGSGELARSAALLGGTLVDGTSAEARECDLCVIERPNLAELEACFETLRSCGSCYAEWRFPRPGGAAAVAELHRRAGFDEPVMYWPAPWIDRAKLWVRIPTPGAGYRDTLRQLVIGSASRPWVGRAVASLIAGALRIGFVPSVVTLARRPCKGSEPCRSDDFCDWLEAGLSTIAGRDVGLMVIMRTGGASDENKINWLVYEGEDRALRWIAKAPRHPASLPMLEREHEAMERFARHRREAPGAVEAPLPVLRTSEPGFSLFVQTAIHGTPLLSAALSEGYPAVAKRLSDSLATLVDARPRHPVAEWWDAQVEPWLARLERQLGSLGDTATAAQVREALSGFTELPLGWTHNDCTPWNTVVTEQGLGLFDWETAEETGLPLVDLVYCLATTAFSLDGTEGTSRSVDSYRRLMEATDERGAAFSEALSQYAHRLALDAGDVSRLRLMTWLVHTTHDLHNLLVATDSPTSALLGECACLPVLRAELARHLAATDPSATVTAIASAGSGEVLFVSPHLDDAVLSCGAAIHRLARSGLGVTIVTVFTEDVSPEQELSPLARSCHEVWGDGELPFATRREEDLRAAGTLGVMTEHLGFLDAVYRLDASGQPIYDFSQRDAVKPADLTACLEPLTERMRALLALHPNATVFSPAGIGDHVDHVLVRRALEEAGAVRLVYYDEYPYLSWTSDARGAGPEDQAEFVLRPTAQELEAHLAAAACYVTQLPGLFPSSAMRLCRIVRERLPIVCRWLPSGPGALEPALRRMETRVRRDKERHGERYHWTDLEWTGPFGG